MPTQSRFRKEATFLKQKSPAGLNMLYTLSINRNHILRFSHNQRNILSYKPWNVFWFYPSHRALLFEPAITMKLKRYEKR